MRVGGRTEPVWGHRVGQASLSSAWACQGVWAALPAPHPEHAKRTIPLCLGSLSLHADEG